MVWRVKHTSTSTGLMVLQCEVGLAVTAAPSAAALKVVKAVMASEVIACLTWGSPHSLSWAASV